MARNDTAQMAEAVTPNDTGSLSDTFGIYVGGPGNLKVDMVHSGTVTFVGVVAGTILPIQVSRVYATGTTASNLIALY
ncbi:MAG TPA: hypothetical protein VFH56_08745 [Acidimicrobiales bacterium]|nr:hypothetical protein [Acidimicrobiales bacterium]